MTDAERFSEDKTVAQIESLSARLDALESSLSEQREQSVRNLQSELDELKTRMGSVESASSSEDDYTTSVATNTPTAPDVFEADANYPFEIMYDAQDEGESQNGAWYIYLPTGCVKHANADVVFQDSAVVKDLSSVHTDYAEIVNVPEVLYGHVKLENGVYKYTIDGTATLSGAVMDFKIAKMEMIDSAANDVCVQYVRGVVVVGGGGGDVTIVGTDASTASGSTITLASASDSNVKATISGTGSNVTITVSNYYV